MKILVAILISILLAGCASCKGTTLWGLGAYKDDQVEIRSESIFANIFGLNLFGEK
jgi:hypothetical protein